MKKNNNKGAAMISVLIATVFIAILATTLLYMAYLNYLTKAIRNASNDNFYTCEYALDDLATSLQQIAAETTSPSEAIQKISLACTGNVAGAPRYDNAKVASIIQTATKMASVSVGCIYPTGSNYIVSANSITLKGLVITARSTADADPYETNISTDLTLTFNASSDGGMNVNDFSIITDDIVDWSHGGVMVMTGDIFIRSQGWIAAHVTYDAMGKGTVKSDAYTSSTDYTDRNRDAVICGAISGTTNGDILSITGDSGIIVGNVVVGSGGTLTITGQVNVIGNIYVINGGTLMCTDKLQCSGKVYTSGGGMIKGVSNPHSLENSSMTVSYLIDKDKAGTGITTNLFGDFYLVYPMVGNSSSTYANYVYAPFTAALETQIHGASACSFAYETPSSLGYFMHTIGSQAEYSIDNVRQSTTYSGVTTKFCSESPLNGLTEPTLLFNARKGGETNKLVLEQILNSTTILSLSQVGNKGSYQNGIRISHMSDADYRKARDIMFVLPNYQSDYFKKLVEVTYLTGSNIGHSAAGNEPAQKPSFFAGNDRTAMNTIIDDWNKGDKATNASAVYHHNGSDGVYVYSYTAGTLATETRYAVFKDGYMYFPYDYFIRPDAGEFITMIFNSLSSDMSPTNTNVSYDNWQKF